MTNLAVSNIAWEREEDNLIYDMMISNGFKGLEIAPTKIKAKLDEITKNDIRTFKASCNSRGISIVAMQSLLFGRPDLKVFEEDNEKTLEYLKTCVDIGRELGAKALVFGSPKNRVIPESKLNRYIGIAMDFFNQIGSYSRANGMTFCLEPNPREYGTNFICTTEEAIDFVRSVDNEGLKVNIDTGTIITNDEDYKKILTGAIPHVGHFHVSEPFLCPINTERKLHGELSRILGEESYTGSVSIEMKSVDGPGNADNIRNVLEGVRKIYSLSSR